MSQFESQNRDLLNVLEIARKSCLPVLLRGPSGSGKSRLAEQIHRSSARSTGPFVRVNLASISPGLLEAELFGAERGAYTGSVARRTGLVRAAHGGTLFLDEIGELPVELQGRLLDVVQQQTVRALGSTQETRVNLRLIAATHRDLECDIEEGRFRFDLFQRLKGVCVELPGLADLDVDFGPIVHSILAEVCERSAARISGLSEGAASLLEAYSWPGNYRELEHVLEYAVSACGQGTLEARHFPAWLSRAVVQTTQAQGRYLDENTDQIGSYRDQMAAFERAFLAAALRAAQGNLSRAARRLRMSPATLHRRVRAVGAHPSEKNLSKKTLRAAFDFSNYQGPATDRLQDV